MTDDLVKRLRSKNCCDATKCNCDEAAERIEALDKRNKELEAALCKIACESTPCGCDQEGFDKSTCLMGIARAALGEKKDGRSCDAAEHCIEPIC